MSQITRPRSRRALLAGAAAGVAAAALETVVKPASVAAAGSDGQAIVVGGTYLDVQSMTGLQNQTNAYTVFAAASNPGPGPGTGTAIQGASFNGVGVYGTSQTNWGVRAESIDGTGLHATSATGLAIDASSGASHAIVGQSRRTDGGYGVKGSTISTTGGAGVYGDGGTTGNGVQGVGQSGLGVYGTSNTTGVLGWSPAGVGTTGSTSTGTGVYAGALQPTALALHTMGRLRVDKVSGVASIATGKTSVTISPGVDITSSSFVLLTPSTSLSGRSLWYTTNATSNTITIRISSARTSVTRVAWLLLG